MSGVEHRQRIIALAVLTGAAMILPSPADAQPAAGTWSRPTPAGKQAHTPEAFVRSIYARRAQTEGEVLSVRLAPFASSSLLTLLRRVENRDAARGEASIDADPVCSCQDDGGMTVRSVRTTQRSARSAQVVAELVFPAPNPSHNVTFLLESTPAGWRITDIDPFDYSLRAGLQEALR